MSKGGLFNIAWALVGTRRLMKVDFKRAGRRDIERLISELNSSSKILASNQ